MKSRPALTSSDFAKVFFFGIIALFANLYFISHGDTYGWLRQLIGFREGLRQGWAAYIAYPPLPQFAWYALSFVPYVPEKLLLSLPNIVSAIVLFVFLRQANVRYAALLTLANPYFWGSGILNAYTDVPFALLSFLALRALFQSKSISLFILWSALALLLKLQFIYFLLWFGIYLLNTQQLKISLLKKEIKTLAGVLAVFVILKLGGFLNGYTELAKTGIMVNQFPNIPSLVWLIKSGFHLSENGAWGSWVWISDSRHYKQLFLACLLACTAMVSFAKTIRIQDKLYLILISVLMFAPAVFINHIGILYGAFLFYLASHWRPRFYTATTLFYTALYCVLWFLRRTFCLSTSAATDTLSAATKQCFFCVPVLLDDSVALILLLTLIHTAFFTFSFWYLAKYPPNSEQE